MPWTFAHPAAVLPLRRFCPGLLNFTALLVGSTTPDIGYYLLLPNLGPFTHSLAGSVLACLPVGLVLLAVLALLRKPLWFVLPQPHRDALAPLALSPLSFQPSALLTAAVSLVLGAWTHIAWDSFTHRNGWMVSLLPSLRKIYWVGGTVYPGYYLLQQLSTLVGAVVLAVAYWLWLRGRLASRSGARDGDGLRYALLVGTTMIALTVASFLAYQAAKETWGIYAFRVFMFHLAIDATIIFVPLFVFSALVFYAAYGRGMPQTKGRAD